MSRPGVSATDKPSKPQALLVDPLSDEDPSDDEILESIRRGMADVNAGRTRPARLRLLKSVSNLPPMPTRVDMTRVFDKEIERLGRKYPAAFDAVDELTTQTENDRRPGSRFPGVGAVVFKARLPYRSARRGRRGGFRVIYYLRFPEMAYLLTFDSKTEKDSVSSAESRRTINTVS